MNVLTVGLGTSLFFTSQKAGYTQTLQLSFVSNTQVYF